MTWPAQADGTVDWVLVFEDSETGLIPLVERADTADKLLACVHVIVQSLFVRDEDKANRRAFLKNLEALIERHNDRHYGDAADLGFLRDNIAILLRSMKTDRIEKARAAAEGATTEEERRQQADEVLKNLDAWLDDVT